MLDGKIVSELKLPKLNGSDIERRVEEVTAKMLEVGI
jgi:putative ABC transport system ATP-binding protein